MHQKMEGDNVIGGGGGGGGVKSFYQKPEKQNGRTIKVQRNQLICQVICEDF